MFDELKWFRGIKFSPIQIIIPLIIISLGFVINSKNKILRIIGSMIFFMFFVIVIVRTFYFNV